MAIALGLVDALSIVRMCTDLGSEYHGTFAAEVAAASGMRAIAVPADDEDGTDVLRNATDSMRSSTSLASEIIERVSDGDLCDNDMKAIEQAMAASTSKKQRLMRSVRAAHAAGKSKLGRGA